MKCISLCLVAAALTGGGCAELNLGRGHKHTPPGQERKMGGPPPGQDRGEGDLPPGRQKKLDGCQAASKDGCEKGKKK